MEKESLREQHPSFKQLSFQDCLRFLRDDCSDEIPEEILNGLSPQKLYKVRRNWWMGVVSVLEQGLRKGEIPDLELQGQVDSFIDYYTSDQFKKQPLTKAEDIAEANRIITLILGDKQEDINQNE
ncbi:hypothetical protein HYW43_00765 [Candidatus Daviesbacteria bacterium]|nr:hypothetical protein [Candidatus Daviesbacteria bacterium]